MKRERETLREGERGLDIYIEREREERERDGYILCRDRQREIIIMAEMAVF